jgi:hypothetical protein
MPGVPDAASQHLERLEGSRKLFKPRTALRTEYNRWYACRSLPGVSEAASQHLERLEGSRKLFIAAGALSGAQRQLLYALDELAMALLRIGTRLEGEQVGLPAAV